MTDMPEEQEASQVPPMIRQGELVDQIGRIVAQGASMGGQWEAVTLHVRRLAPYGETGMVVVRPSGEDRSHLPDRSIGHLIKELRDVMYREGAGTWLSMRLEVRRTGENAQVAVSFNYDNEPAWSDPPSPGLYAKDLHKYPRDPENVPDWMAALLPGPQ